MVGLATRVDLGRYRIVGPSTADSRSAGRGSQLHSRVVRAASGTSSRCYVSATKLGGPRLPRLPDGVRHCCEKMQVASPHTGRVPSAIVGRRLDCADCSRLYRGHEHHKADHSEGERRETQNLFHKVPMHFPVPAERARQLADLLAMRGQSDFRDCCPSRAPVP